MTGFPASTNGCLRLGSYRTSTVASFSSGCAGCRGTASGRPQTTRCRNGRCLSRYLSCDLLVGRLRSLRSTGAISTHLTFRGTRPFSFRTVIMRDAGRDFDRRRLHRTPSSVRRNGSSRGISSIASVTIIAFSSAKGLVAIHACYLLLTHTPLPTLMASPHIRNSDG